MRSFNFANEYISKVLKYSIKQTHFKLSSKTIQIKVIANAKKAEVKEIENGLKVKANAPAINNKANKAVIAILADHFQVKPKQVKIVNGLQNPNKTVEILDN